MNTGERRKDKILYPVNGPFQVSGSVRLALEDGSIWIQKGWSITQKQLGLREGQQVAGSMEKMQIEI